MVLVCFLFSQGHSSNQLYHNKEVTIFILASFCDKSTSHNEVGSLPLLFGPVSEGRRDGKQEKEKKGNSLEQVKVCVERRLRVMVSFVMWK